MAIRSAEAAATRAQASTTNKPGMCQQWTRQLFNAPSVGDVDSDGDADAVDGWKKEPKGGRHTDKNPPRGAPIAWAGGRSGFGHRAISLGNGYIRSIDAGGRGRVATVTLGWVEKNWGLDYLGWSETISGIAIPGLKFGPVVIPPGELSVNMVAKQVIKGEWGNGEDRVRRLKKAGYNPDKVQKEVNRLLNL